MVSLVDDTAAAAIKNQDTLCAISEAVVEDLRSLRSGESASLHSQEVSLFKVRLLLSSGSSRVLLLAGISI